MNKFKRITALIVVFCCILVGVVSAAPEESALVFYVATDGSDSNDGSFNAPFATVNKAREVIAAKKSAGQLPSGGAVVNIRGGEYPMTGTIYFNNNDSGRADAPIIYQAYNNEKVVFYGGKHLDISKAKPVTDSAILNRIIDVQARGKIYQLDLKEQGIDWIEERPTLGYYQKNIGYKPIEFYFNGLALTDARWPKKGQQGVGDDGVDNGFVYMANTAAGSNTFTYTNPRPNLWQTKDIYISGPIPYTWATVDTKLTGINHSNQTATVNLQEVFDQRLNNDLGYARYYYHNILEEISLPGESYIDREKLILYFYPPEDMENAYMEASWFGNDQMMVFNNVSYVTLKGLTFTLGRWEGLRFNNCSNIVVDGCEFSRFSLDAFYADGVKDFTIKNSHFFELGRGAVRLRTGDRRNLISGNVLIENNHFHTFNRLDQSYYPALDTPYWYIYAVGVTVRNNLFNDSPHMVIRLHGNNNTYEYNEFYDCVREASDQGVFYWGRDVAFLGHKIQYNYFHDIGNSFPGYGTQSIFIDDGCSDTLVYGNVFYKASGGRTPDRSYPFKTNGGQYNKVINNIFIDNPYAVGFEVWTRNAPDETWKAYVTGNGDGRAKDIDISSPRVLEAYPWLSTLYGEAPTNSNIMECNVVVGSGGSMHGAGQEYSTYTTTGDPGFVDYENQNFALKPGSKVFSALPEFENIPFDRIGLRSKVSGEKPVAQKPLITGITRPGKELTARYVYTDIDGDMPGRTEYQWYVSDSQNGTYTPILNRKAKTLTLDTTDGINYNNKYVKVSITPVDSRLIKGETVESEPVLIRTSNLDSSALSELIADANQYLYSTNGNYPISAKAAFEDAIKSATDALQKSKSTTDLKAAETSLKYAMQVFQSANLRLTMVSATQQTDGSITDVTFNNEGQNAYQGVIIAAKYNGDTFLEMKKYTGITIPASTTTPYTVKLDGQLRADAEERVKIMFLSNIENVEPLTNFIELKNQEK